MIRALVLGTGAAHVVPVPGMSVRTDPTMKGTAMSDPSRARAALTPVTVTRTRHAWYCACPACPPAHRYRPNDGEPCMETYVTVEYARPAAGLTAAAARAALTAAGARDVAARAALLGRS